MVAVVVEPYFLYFYFWHKIFSFEQMLLQPNQAKIITKYVLLWIMYPTSTYLVGCVIQKRLVLVLLLLCRLHILNHLFCLHHSIDYMYILLSFILQAERERDITVEHLADIDRLVNESLQMLSRFQDLNTKILPLMEDYLIALRSRDNTPASLLRMDKDHEEEMINNYTSDMKSRIQGMYVIDRY